MSDTSKVTPSHTHRAAVIYVRQSSSAQVEHNRESTERQYALVHRAVDLGWQREQVTIIDDDLGLSGSGIAKRAGFARLAADVALAKVGIVLGLEVSRLARNNADWYRLLDLCGMTDTLIGDADGVYHPALFNDRLVLGLKGTMSEAELHILRARLDGGIRNKAARGELRRGLPVGFVWGDARGRGPLPSRRSRDQRDPRRLHPLRRTRLGAPSLALVPLRRAVVPVADPRRRGHPLGRADVHGDSPCAHQSGICWRLRLWYERAVSGTSTTDGTIQQRIRRLPRAEWAVLLPNHHEGFIDWETYEANQARIDSNVHPHPHLPGGAVREGAALLQGLATCGHCGRRLHTHYSGRSCRAGLPLLGQGSRRGPRRLLPHRRRDSDRRGRAPPPSSRPSRRPPSMPRSSPPQQLDADDETALAQWRLAVERARYEAERAERRYRAVEPENRLVARGLETEWEQRLRDLELAQRELEAREQQRRRALGPDRRRTPPRPRR